MAYGALQPWPLLSQCWIVTATAHRLGLCYVTQHLMETLSALGRPYGVRVLEVDRAKQNLKWYEARQSVPQTVERLQELDVGL